MRILSLFADLRLWTRRRWVISASIAVVVGAGLVTLAGTVAIVGGFLVAPGAWWTYVLTGIGAAVVGLVAGSYCDAPIGAAATLCDLRWPVLGSIAIYLSTDLNSAVPILTGLVRPVVALAAIALLAWALLERLEAERAAQKDNGDGVACTTCRPLFPLARG